MNFLLKSRKVQRFLDRRFAAAEARIAAANEIAQVRAHRSDIRWTDVPALSDFGSFFTFHDQRCPDVVGMSTQEWWCSHFRGRYRIHLESDKTLSYTCAEEDGSWHFQSDATPGTWIYLVSRQLLPTTYAIEFDYTPRTVFREQLQLDFAAYSLAERHRFIISNNERLRYHLTTRGFLLPDVSVMPCSLPLSVATRIRLEVCGRTFSLLFGRRVLSCWEDRGYDPRPARCFMVFWNGTEAREMDFSVSNFKFQVPETESYHFSLPA